MSQVWIALGSNLGDRGATLSLAIRRLAESDLPASRLSHVYETEPEHGVDEPAYLNAVLQTESDRDPAALLEILQRIEEEFGRPRAGDESRNGARTLDLDLLAVGDLVLEDASEMLVLPHPRLHLRAFVLVPLCEIDPHWTHPANGRTAASLLAELEVTPGSVRLHGSLGHEASGCGPYPWRQLPARGGI